MPERVVHVSLHDVSPAWEREIDLALELCHARRIRPALLVVPDFHGAAPLAHAPAFAARLAALEADGHEVLLHGFFHRSGAGDAPRAAPSPGGDDGRPGRLGRFYAQKVVSGGEAEFSDVGRAEAEARLDEGLRVLRDAGLSPTGFVPPAWSMRPWLRPLLAARGLAFTEDHAFVYDTARGARRLSLVLNYASRTAGRLLSTVAFNRVARPAAWALPTRVALHPADLRFRLLRSELEGLLDWASAGRVVARGADLLA